MTLTWAVIKKAAKENRSLNDLIVEAIEQKVYSVMDKPASPYHFSPATHHGGGFKKGIDPTDNSSLLDAMDGIDGSS